MESKDAIALKYKFVSEPTKYTDRNLTTTMKTNIKRYEFVVIAEWDDRRRWIADEFEAWRWVHLTICYIIYIVVSIWSRVLVAEK